MSVCLSPHRNLFLAHLSRRFKGELIVYLCSGVRHRCRRQPFSNMNISEANRLIAIKFYLKHHWDRGKAAWVFGADQFRTQASMATDSFHSVIMGKTASSRFLECFDRILFILASSYMYDMNKNFDEFEIQPDSTTEFAALECMKKYLIMVKTM